MLTACLGSSFIDLVKPDRQNNSQKEVLRLTGARFLTGLMPFLSPNPQFQSNEGIMLDLWKIGWFNNRLAVIVVQ